MYTIVDKKLGQLLSDVGVSQMLFNSDKASAEALKKSIIVDSVYVLSHILKMFENYINFELSNISSKHMCKILDNTYFNQDERRESAKEDLGYGGSKFVYLASCGFTPLESQNILATEKLLGLNNLFVPIETSHTQSGKDKKGRPSTDDTKKMKDSTENVKEGE